MLTQIVAAAMKEELAIMTKADFRKAMTEAYDAGFCEGYADGKIDAYKNIFKQHPELRMEGK